MSRSHHPKSPTLSLSSATCCAQLWDYLVMAAHSPVNAMPEDTRAPGGRGELGIAPPGQQRPGGRARWLAESRHSMAVFALGAGRRAA
jgi:hypothetical protein